MQIHELNSFSGTPSANDYLVTDNGTDTSKIPATELIAPAVNAVTDEVATRQSADALLQSQIDQFVAPTGTAPNPAEIENARIGADNVTYTTLGEAIRTQVTDVKSALIDIDGAVINKARLVLGNINASTSGWVYQVRTYGVITQQGYEIPIDIGTRIYLTDYTSYKIGISWKDANNNYGTSGWITSGYFETTVKGVYVLNVQLKNTDNTASVDDVYSILRINGGRLNAVEKQVEELTPLPPTASSEISRIKIVDTINNAWGQGVALVGDYVLMFNASNDQHTNHANIDVYNISDLTTKLFSVEHNLGHCASADYNKETDTLLIANGTYASGVDSLIFLIPNISTLLENRTSLEYGSANVHEINITALSGEGVVACFGEQANVIYAVKVLDGTNYDTVLTKYFYKLYVGKGTTNMVSTFPAASVGTYTAQADGVPNGTARILMSGSLDFAGELQGLKYDGRLLLPFDTRKLIHTDKLPYLAMIETTSAFTLKEICYLYLAYDNGNVKASEMEDLFITDTNLAYVSNGSKIYSILI